MSDGGRETTGLERGDTFVDDYGDEFVVESVEDGMVHFEDFYDHYVDEVLGFVEDGLWEREDGDRDD